jgi:hypothetical protein
MEERSVITNIEDERVRFRLRFPLNLGDQKFIILWDDQSRDPMEIELTGQEFFEQVVKRFPSREWKPVIVVFKEQADYTESYRDLDDVKLVLSRNKFSVDDLEYDGNWYALCVECTTVEPRARRGQVYLPGESLAFAEKEIMVSPRKLL